jgi:hypothetical protein
MAEGLVLSILLIALGGVWGIYPYMVEAITTVQLFKLTYYGIQSNEKVKIWIDAIHNFSSPFLSYLFMLRILDCQCLKTYESIPNPNGNLRMELP